MNNNKHRNINIEAGTHNYELILSLSFVEIQFFFIFISLWADKYNCMKSIYDFDYPLFPANIIMFWFDLTVFIRLSFPCLVRQKYVSFYEFKFEIDENWIVCFLEASGKFGRLVMRLYIRNSRQLCFHQVLYYSNVAIAFPVKLIYPNVYLSSHNHRLSTLYDEGTCQ